MIQPETIYLGGGTPTALSTKHLALLLSGLRERLDCSALLEWNLEANPRTVDAAKARMLKDHGVTRVSLGVQAWDEPTLKTLGRDHSPAEARETYELLREAGIPSLNIDLMFSIPGLSLPVWQENLTQTLALKPDHISCYNLTYEEDTDFLNQHRAGELDSDGDRDADHFESTIELLTSAGFAHYEISNYARPGHHSRHNQSYWMGEDYLGLGPSAVSTCNRTRWKNVTDTNAYISLVGEGRAPVGESESLTDRQWQMERVALQLRTERGLPVKMLEATVSRNLAMLQNEGLVALSEGQIKLTRRGKALADQVAEMLISDS